jgi:pimeloyl-ACP methyl ester carboxylesterase
MASRLPPKHVHMCLELCVKSYEWENLDRQALRKYFLDAQVIGDTTTNTRMVVAPYRHDADSGSINVMVACKGTEFGKIANNMHEKSGVEDILLALIDPTDTSDQHLQDGAKDLLSDSLFALHKPPDIGDGVVVHYGFHRAAQSVVDGLIDHLKTVLSPNKDAIVTFTGHSLGAAVATLLTAMTRKRLARFCRNLSVSLVTFGSPHVGNTAFADVVTSSAFHVQRYASRLDLIPKLLGFLPSVYVHVGPETTMRENGVRQSVDFANNILNASPGCGPGITAANIGKFLSDNLVRVHGIDEYKRYFLLGDDITKPLLTLGGHAYKLLREKDEKNGDIPKTLVAMKNLLPDAKSATSVVGNAAGGVVSAAAAGPLLLVSAGASIVAAGASIYTAVKVHEVQAQVKTLQNAVDAVKMDTITIVEGQHAMHSVMKERFSAVETGVNAVYTGVHRAATQAAANTEEMRQSFQALQVTSDQQHADTLAEMQRLHTLDEQWQVHLHGSTQAVVLQALSQSTERIIENIESNSDRVIAEVHSVQVAKITKSNGKHRAKLQGVLSHYAKNRDPDGKLALLLEVGLQRMGACVDALVVCAVQRAVVPFLDTLAHTEATLELLMQMVGLCVSKWEQNGGSIASKLICQRDWVDKLHVWLGRLVHIRIMLASDATADAATVSGRLPPICYRLTQYFVSLVGVAAEEAADLATNYASQAGQADMERAFALNPLCVRGHAVRLHSYAYAMSVNGELRPMTPVELDCNMRSLLLSTSPELSRDDIAVLMDVCAASSAKKEEDGCSLDLLLLAALRLQDLSLADDRGGVLAAVDIALPLLVRSWDPARLQYRAAAVRVTSRALKALQSAILFDRSIAIIKSVDDISVEEISLAMQQLLCVCDRFGCLAEIDADLVEEVTRAALSTPYIAPYFLEHVERTFGSPLSSVSGMQLAKARRSVVPAVTDDLDELWPGLKHETSDSLIVRILKFRGSRTKSGPRELCELPEAICCLVHLQELYAAALHLTTIPRSIQCLQRLRTLSLAGNDIEQLPDELGELTSLEFLDVARNSLLGLPSSMEKLVNLETLILSRNRIGLLPRVVFQLAGTKLVRLEIDAAVTVDPTLLASVSVLTIA